MAAESLSKECQKCSCFRVTASQNMLANAITEERCSRTHGSTRRLIKLHQVHMHYIIYIQCCCRSKRCKQNLRRSPTQQKMAARTRSAAVEAKQRGNDAYLRQAYEEAITEYSTAISLDPRNALLLTNRSATYFAMGRFDESSKDARAASQIDPKMAKAYYRAGMVYDAHGCLPLALKQLFSIARVTLCDTEGD